MNVRHGKGWRGNYICVCVCVCISGFPLVLLMCEAWFRMAPFRWGPSPVKLGMEPHAESEGPRTTGDLHDTVVSEWLLDLRSSQQKEVVMSPDT